METALTKLARGCTMQSDLRPALSEAALTQGPCLRTSLRVRSRVPGFGHWVWDQQACVTVLPLSVSSCRASGTLPLPSELLFLPPSLITLL